MKRIALTLRRQILRGLAFPFLVLPLLAMVCCSFQSLASERNPYTSFTVDTRNIRIPDLADLAPITDKMQAEGKQIKTITFYGLTPSIGMGSMYDNMESLKKAKSLSKIKEYTEILREYAFDRDGKIEELMLDPMEAYQFEYDSFGRPVEIESASLGYRGSPTYMVKYTINWNGDTPTTIDREIEEFESDFIDKSELEFETDFTGRTSEFINMLVKNTGSDFHVSGNTCKLVGEDDAPVWCEIIYY